MGEPRTVNVNGEDRYVVRVTFHGGSAIAQKKNEDAVSAMEGEEYDLWLTKTLSGAILSALGWKEGKPAPKLSETSWKVFRTGAGQRWYDVEPVGDIQQTLNKEANNSIVSIAESFRNDATLKALTEIDRPTWNRYLMNKGHSEQEAEAITAKMVELGIIREDELMIYYEG
jgi:hypothetical protein